MGGCEAELEAIQSKIPRLHLFNPPPMHSPEPSGMVTPPLYTSASVPFGWEEEPGKPRPCTALVSFSIPTPKKLLELPPRLLIDANLTTKQTSPTTVLDGPYYMGSSSVSEDCFGSFSAERGQLGTMDLNKGMRIKEKGCWFGSWRKKDLKVKHVFPSSADKDTDHIGILVGSHKNVRKRKMKRYGSFTNPFHAKSRLWTKICEGWKQVVPWRSKKLERYGSWWP